jgi:hypothetical protein
MKIFSILVLGTVLTACAPGVFNPANGIPMASDESWNLKITDKTGKVLSDENYKLSGSFRSWSQTENFPTSTGSGLVFIKNVETYSIGQINFSVLPIESTEIAAIRSDKHSGAVASFSARDTKSKRLEIYPDSNKSKVNQESCIFYDFTNLSRFQSDAVRFSNENSNATTSVGTCTFTKLEPAPK